MCHHCFFLKSIKETADQKHIEEADGGGGGVRGCGCRGTVKSSLLQPSGFAAALWKMKERCLGEGRLAGLTVDELQQQQQHLWTKE